MQATITHIEHRKNKYIVSSSSGVEYTFFDNHKRIEEILKWQIGSQIHHEGVDNGAAVIGCNVFHESSKRPFFVAINSL